MEIDSQTGLVLEGGGMRAIFTVGVWHEIGRAHV